MAYANRGATNYLRDEIDPILMPIIQGLLKERPHGAANIAAVISRIAAEAAGPGQSNVQAGPVLAPLERRQVLMPATLGDENTLEYRIHSHKRGDNAAVVSLWNDVPLYEMLADKPTGNVNFVCEIPKTTRKKYEIATDEVGNPIKQDEKKGVLREFKLGDLHFNYGCLPRTWEDPAHISADTGCQGDNDPIDVCEIGLRLVPTGGVRTVKVLGILAMIDEGETDWKVVAIDVTDPWAASMNDIEDVDTIMPGALSMIREWFRLYKVPDGKPENKFGLDERFESREYALKVIEETHQAWKQLQSLGGEKTKLNVKSRPSMSNVLVPIMAGGLGPEEKVPVIIRAAALNPIEGPAVNPVTEGAIGTHEYRVRAYKAGSKDKELSLWHDIPLYVKPCGAGRTPTLNFICEIPKWTRKKYEISTKDQMNPIKQDEKKGVLREFKRGDLAFNYGCFPRTWEDPAFVHPDTGVGGDGDPLDVCEIGLRQVSVAGIREVKVLGVLAMIDDGETDWKVVAIDVTDKWAPLLNGIDDVEEYMPGTLHAIREWFRLYKVPDGKPENKFALDERFESRDYALKIVAETHDAWVQLCEDTRNTKFATTRRLSMA
jgi:inorganic pyrophosphatase